MSVIQSVFINSLLLRIIQNNPFRILGVYSNASPAEVVSNCDDIEAYLSVGQNIQFDLDFNFFLPPVNRTIQTVQQAKSNINLPKRKLKNAFFWFFKDSASTHAMNYIKNGDFDNAFEVLDIEGSVSSMINKAIIGILRKNDPRIAIHNVSRIIHDDSYRSEFVNAICGNAFSIGEEELAHLYIDTLLEEVPAEKLIKLFQENGVSEDDDQYLKEKAVDEPISRINAEINKARSVARDDADANYLDGQELITNTKTDLAKVKNLLNTSDLKYQMIADDLAKTILQCGINYYNNSDEDEADRIEKALTIQGYALSIAVGKLTVDRCRENVDILKKKKEQLPPPEVKEHDTAIKAIILKRIVLGGQTIDNAIAMMKETAPHIVAMKEHPEIREYYLNISTQVVNAALSSVIEEYNTVTERVGPDLKNASRRDSAIQILKQLLKKAWTATLMMDKFNKEEAFQNGRYQENRKSLYEIVESSGVYVTYIGVNRIPQSISNDELDLRTEDDVFDECCTSADYKAYLNRYPNAKHKTAAKNRYDKLFAEEEAKRKEKEGQERKARLKREIEDKAFKACASKSDYKEYLHKFPNGHYKWEAERKISELKEQNRKTGCTVAIVALILGGGIIGALLDGSGGGFLLGCGFIAVCLFLAWLKSL